MQTIIRNPLLALFKKKKSANSSNEKSNIGALDFWRKQLDNTPSSLDLPRDFIGLGMPETLNSYEEIYFSPALCESLKLYANQVNVSEYAVLLAGYLSILNRYTGQKDILITTSSWRLANNYKQDCFVQPEIKFYCCSYSDLASFQDACLETQQAINYAADRVPVSIEQIPNIRHDKLVDNQNNLLQLVFDFDKQSNAQSVARYFSGKSELYLSIKLHENNYVARLYYDKELYESSTIQQLLGHYQNLLLSGLACKTQPVAQLSFLSQDETQKILYDWNNSHVNFPMTRLVHQLFEDKAVSVKEAEAIVFNDTRITYGELNNKANKLANYLRSCGVKTGDLVGIYLNRCPDAIIAILAILKAGGAYLPLDASYPKDRIAYILNDAKTDVLITHVPLYSDILNTVKKVIFMDQDWERISRHDKTNPISFTTSQDIAFVLYTSGSTGNPKGVEVTHSNLINYFYIWEYNHQLTTSISAICQMTFFSFAVFQGDLVRALCAGKKLVLCSQETLMSPRKLFELMLREKVDFAEFVPVLLRGLAAHVEESGANLHFMKVVVVGADRWYFREHLQVQKLCADNSCLIHVYGLSETTLDSAHFTHTDITLPLNQLTPIGRPFQNVSLYILDEHLQPVPIGLAGELCIGGAGVAKGYRNRPELTAEKFILNPFNNDNNNRIFRTGDYARFLKDGNIAFLGRRDQQVKIRGFRVELGEIEACMEQHPNIKTAVVQPFEADPGITNLIGYYLPLQPVLNYSEIREYLAEKLPDFMVPAHLIQLDTLPLTPSGKINRSALPKPDLSGKQQHYSDTVSTTSSEKSIISKICCHALGIENLNAEQQFFHLGGDSMSIMTMVTGLESAFGVIIEEDEINPITFASIASLTSFIDSKLNDQTSGPNNINDLTPS